jgi:hypothetical protein
MAGCQRRRRERLGLRRHAGDDGRPCEAGQESVQPDVALGPDRIEHPALLGVSSCSRPERLLELPDPLVADGNLVRPAPSARRWRPRSACALRRSPRSETISQSFFQMLRFATPGEDDDSTPRWARRPAEGRTLGPTGAWVHERCAAGSSVVRERPVSRSTIKQARVLSYRQVWIEHF